MGKEDFPLHDGGKIQNPLASCQTSQTMKFSGPAVEYK